MGRPSRSTPRSRFAGAVVVPSPSVFETHRHNTHKPVPGSLPPTARRARSRATQVSLDVGRLDEPDIYSGEAAANLTAAVTASELVAGQQYVLYRFDGGNAHVPAEAAAFAAAADAATPFTPSADTWRWTDPTPFLSSGSTTYRCVLDGDAVAMS